jgi:hypothetical protein
MKDSTLPTTSCWLRLTRGGVSLAPFERFLLRRLEEHVPPELASILRRQWDGLNLIQRSPDWEELRFYRIVRGRVDRSALPLLPVRDGEVKLLSLALRPTPGKDPLHVNLWAVNGWFFSLNASAPYRPYRALTAMHTEGVEHSYRSNLGRRGA